MSNKCNRCGKERVVVKTHKEKVGSSYVFYREMTCPDKECQKRVDDVLSKEKVKRDNLKIEQLKREEERKKRSADSHK